MPTLAELTLVSLAIKTVLERLGHLSHNALETAEQRRHLTERLDQLTQRRDQLLSL